jgi:hypothetical protein
VRWRGSVRQRARCWGQELHEFQNPAFQLRIVTLENAR